MPTRSATACAPPPASRAIRAAMVGASSGGGAAGGSQDSAVHAESSAMSSPSGRGRALFFGDPVLREKFGSATG